MAAVLKAAVLGAGICLSCSSEPAAENHTKPPHDSGLIEDLDAAADAPTPADSAKDGPAANPYSGPMKLSETGLYLDIGTRTLAPGVRPFDVRYPLWSDGAEKARYFSLPPGTTIDTSYMDVWKFPIGTKAWKEFRQDGKLVETRFLWKQAEGADGWLKIAFLWNEDESDALAIPDGLTNARGTTHDVPSIFDCTQCHNGNGDVMIGVSAIQLSKETGGGYLSKLIADGVLSDPPSGEFPVPGDGDVEFAIGYLHGNCGYCHNNESWLAKYRLIRLKLLTSSKTPEETGLYQTAINAKMNHVLQGTVYAVVPGKPVESQLLERMIVRDLDMMPPLDTKQVDTNSTPKISSWILGLPTQ